jgi:diguanylate cyclase (GGDEF)-like protein
VSWLSDHVGELRGQLRGNKLFANLKSLAVFGSLAGEWWREAVDYDAQVQYFAKRAMAGGVQVLIGLGTGLNAVITLVVVLPSASTNIAQLSVAMFGLLEVFWAWVWCSEPWPSRRMSLVFVISADIGIAAVALSGADRLLGLSALTAFSMISVFLMFFDGPRMLAGHVLWTLLTAAVFVVQVGNASQFDAVEATVRTLAVLSPMVATPLGIQCGIWAMRKDANESVTDPLTGLLNRRGLHLHLTELFRETTAAGAELTVMVVDLDRFKHINDTFGHTVGDEVLIRCARRIKSVVRGSALVTRIGGEEFVIIDLAAAEHAERDADQVRLAIAARAAQSVTASVGVTSVAITRFAVPGIDPIAMIDKIIERADHAMFEAKRHGGNATVHMESADLDD